MFYPNPYTKILCPLWKVKSHGNLVLSICTQNFYCCQNCNNALYANLEDVQCVIEAGAESSTCTSRFNFTSLHNSSPLHIYNHTTSETIHHRGLTTPPPRPPLLPLSYSRWQFSTLPKTVTPCFLRLQALRHHSYGNLKRKGTGYGSLPLPQESVVFFLDVTSPSPLSMEPADDWFNRRHCVHLLRAPLPCAVAFHTPEPRHDMG